LEPGLLRGGLMDAPPLILSPNISSYGLDPRDPRASVNTTSLSLVSQSVRNFLSGLSDVTTAVMMSVYVAE